MRAIRLAAAALLLSVVGIMGASTAQAGVSVDLRSASMQSNGWAWNG